MLKKIRIVLATISIALITLLFLDYTGVLHSYFGFIAKIQFIPALLSLNIAVIIFILLLTLVFGRIYCSVICPLGIMQDAVSYIAERFKKKRFRYRKPKSIVRYSALSIFILLWIAGFSYIVILFEPYSIYGRIASYVLNPIFLFLNNMLAYIADRIGSYDIYQKEIYIEGIITMSITIIPLLVIGIWAWFKDRDGYCNTICPVGSFLGLISKYSLIKPIIHKTPCVECGVCANKCRASCIDPNSRTIDYSRCVSCMDCLRNCLSGAIKLEYQKPNIKSKLPVKSSKENEIKNPDRRLFLSTAGTIIGAAAIGSVQAKTAKLTGNKLSDNKIRRENTILPPGAISIERLNKKCTACQLCISSCPSNILKPSSDFTQWMQPIVDYQNKYCDINCNTCSQVCPTGAILKQSIEEKKNLQIGIAVWVPYRCVVVQDNVRCGICSRQCPNDAIKMIPTNSSDPNSMRVPNVDLSKCIGCGKCEYICPATPLPAIYVEGLSNQRYIK